MTVSAETARRSVSTPERLDSRLGGLDFVDGVPSRGTSEIEPHAETTSRRKQEV